MTKFVYPVITTAGRFITSKFGIERNGYGANGKHEGVDLRAYTRDSVVSVLDGEVIKVGKWDGTKRGMNAYGNYVAITHELGGVSWYCHLIETEVIVGDKVARGQLVGFAGSTGNSTAPHLHFMYTNEATGFDGFVFKKVTDPTDALMDAEIIKITVVNLGVNKKLTNQSVINILYKQIAPRFKMIGADLVENMGWNWLYEDRKALFDLVHLQTKPRGIRDGQWALIASSIFGQVRE